MSYLNHLLWDVQADVFSGWDHSQLPKWSYSNAHNPHFRIWYVHHGKLRGDLDGCETVVSAGDVCFWQAAKEVHFSNCSETEPVSYISVLFTLKSSQGIPLRYLPGLPVVMHDVDVPYVIGMLTEIVREIKRRDVAYRLAARSKIQELLVHFARHVHVLDGWQMSADFRLQPVVDYLTAHPDVYVTSADMAKLQNVSEVHLRRMFKRWLGTTPNNFVQQFKVDQGISLLKESDYSIKEIAFRLGFDSPNYFATVFRHFAGCSPREYRKMLRRNMNH